ncbi:MAG TPA: TldD/PmbA family protein [Thermoanaerobaculia bacterium]|nr:TldD/PmbA family protein [Thermoanaerobaculia bacterium]
MPVLTEAEAQAILKRVLALAKSDGCEANLQGNRIGNVRYARNAITTSGVVDDLTLVVQSNFGKRSGTATINEFDDAALARVVRRSQELARLAPENPEFMEILGPQGPYQNGKSFFEATAKIDPAYRAQAAADSIGPARDAKVVAAGFLQDTAGFQSMMNSKGLFAYHAATGVSFTITMRTEDGLGSGWAARDFNDAAKLDAKAASRIALDKALRSREAKAIEPGKYTVVLEPAASIDILADMFFSMNARPADEGRSFLAKKGGGTKLGEKIVDERVTIYSDPTDPDVPVAGWSGDGQRQERISWIERGVVKNLPTGRFWAQKQGRKPIPFPGNVIMMGGSGTTEDLIKDTKRGVLVTRAWYIREVDPQTVLVTGLTRDGTFFIENGKISFPIKNMRFNDSAVIMLNNLEALGKPVRIEGEGVNSVMIPPMRIREFNFSSLSDAV